MTLDAVMPGHVACYKQTPEFDEIPPGLRQAHNTKPGVWGLLKILAGSVDFVDEPSGARRRLQAGETQVIEPQRLHHLESAGEVRFQVDFYR